MKNSLLGSFSENYRRFFVAFFFVAFFFFATFLAFFFAAMVFVCTLKFFSKKMCRKLLTHCAKLFIRKVSYE
jgi:hypothetical protein